MILLSQNVLKGPETAQDISNEVVTERHTPYCALYFCYCRN